MRHHAQSPLPWVRGAASAAGLGRLLGLEVTPEAGVPPSLRGPRGHAKQGGERGAAFVGLQTQGEVVYLGFGEQVASRRTLHEFVLRRCCAGSWGCCNSCHALGGGGSRSASSRFWRQNCRLRCWQDTPSPGSWAAPPVSSSSWWPTPSSARGRGTVSLLSRGRLPLG